MICKWCGEEIDTNIITVQDHLLMDCKEYEEYTKNNVDEETLKEEGIREQMEDDIYFLKSNSLSKENFDSRSIIYYDDDYVDWDDYREEDDE